MTSHLADVTIRPVNRSVPKPEAANTAPPADADADRVLNDGAEARDPELSASAREFESVFIAEMLSHAGFEKALSGESGFGGEAFAGFLVQIYAERLSENGGLGFADKIYAQLETRPSS